MLRSNISIIPHPTPHSRYTKRGSPTRINQAASCRPGRKGVLWWAKRKKVCRVEERVENQEGSTGGEGGEAEEEVVASTGCPVRSDAVCTEEGKADCKVQ
jgi:hypothetical protein